MAEHEVQPSPIVLVLAAGRARRFGSDKRFATLDGQPVIQHVLRSLEAADIPMHAIRVCVADNDTTMADCPGTSGQATLLRCPNAREGMGHTLADAVAATADASGWLVCLADMPYIRPSTYALIWAHAALPDTHRHLLAPSWQGQRGHPVFFGKNWREALLSLRGDVGARPLLSRYHEHLALLSVDDPGITLDIDTSSDLNRPLILGTPSI